MPVQFRGADGACSTVAYMGGLYRHTRMVVMIGGKKMTNWQVLVFDLGLMANRRILDLGKLFNDLAERLVRHADNALRKIDADIEEALRE